MKILLYMILLILCLSCDRKSIFETTITKGFWLLYLEPNRMINNPKIVIGSCIKFTEDGSVCHYTFNSDGSVDTTCTDRYDLFDSYWRYTSNDSFFCIGTKDNFDKFKFLDIKADTIIFKTTDSCTYFNKGDVIYLVKYNPQNVTISSEDSVIRFK